MGGVDGKSLKKELETCEHSMVDSETTNGRNRVYNLAMVTLDTKNLLGNLDVVLDSLKCAAKMKVAFGLVLKNVEDRSCRYFYANQKNTILERPKLEATTEELTEIKNMLNKDDVIESFTRERAHTN